MNYSPEIGYFTRQLRNELGLCPETGEAECTRCSGEYCDTHGTRPCDCDTQQRHEWPGKYERTDGD